MSDTDSKIENKDVKSDPKAGVLDAAISHINKLFGKGSIMRLQGAEFEGIEKISTGSIALDDAIGIGGYPKGRVIEIFGAESSGKTTIALHAIAECQKSSGNCAFVDAEHALDTSYAKKLGVNIDQLILSQPDNGEQALEIVDILIRSGAVDMIVVDSVAALTPKAEIDGEMGDSHMGLQARLLSQAMRKITASVSKTKCIVIFINQIRMKIGVVFGNPETTTGGNALKFYSSVRMEIRRLSALKDKEVVVGNQTRVKIVKNKVAPPFRQAEFDIIYNKGICKYGELIDIGVSREIINKSGSYYSYMDTKMGQGRENVKLFLQQNPELFEEIKQKVIGIAA